MTGDDEAARAAAAGRLEKTIDELVTKGAAAGPPHSPRDFIHQKMAEEAAADRGGKKAKRPKK